MKKTIKDIALKGKKALIRVDFNVPLDKELNITDDSRIRAALPTIQYVLDNGASAILMSHLGRPKGKVVDSMRLTPAVKRLGKLMGKKVTKLDDCVGPDVEAAAARMKPGDVVILENLRFHLEEEANDREFSKKLAGLGDVFINDAFGTAHRAHASTEGVTKYLPSVAGFLLQKEIEYLGKVLTNPVSPFVAILGGSKVSDKIGVVENLLDKVNTILIGGGMAYTFLKSLGTAIGDSKLEADKIALAGTILQKAEAKKVKIVLPVDHVIVQKLEQNAPSKVTDGLAIPDGWMGVDIGPKSAELFTAEVKTAKTVLWNGPLGVFEIDPFGNGSREVAAALADSHAVSVLGGGDTASCVAKFSLSDAMTHISTGGGASLEYLEGRVLPGIDALNDKEDRK
ncbi:MAG: phosphoglycerate kinase [Candidatus Omnitrophota bacterium]